MSLRVPFRGQAGFEFRDLSARVALDFEDPGLTQSVRIYGVSALALFFFDRWHIQLEPLPNLSSQSWFSTKTFPSLSGSSYPEDALSYQGHLKFINEVD